MNFSLKVIVFVTTVLYTGQKIEALKCHATIGSTDGSLKYDNVQTCKNEQTCVHAPFLQYDNDKTFWVGGCAPLKFCYNELIANEYIETTIQTYLQKSIKVWRIQKKNCCTTDLCNNRSGSIYAIQLITLLSPIIFLALNLF
ncbi:unnamed protein product [Brachionus calyciflorus]|uniref:Uncharacterized protein n=1 Tax=Brachionus calyciflorus TaxID=104777 RepID=A0A814M8U6_9BILA|nr:unnamed protein product [Brachionus calyciflorus]